MKRFFLFILISTCISGFLGTQDAFCQQQLVKKAVKLTAKEASKKTLAKASAKATSKYANSWLRTYAKRTIKNKGYKSIAAYTKNEGKEILNSSKIMQTPTSVKDRFKSSYSNSIGKKIANKNIFSLKRTASSATGLLIHTAADAIKVTWDRKKRGYVPAINAKDLSPKEAAKLLGIRRKAISPYNQFATMDQLNKYDKSLMVLGKEKDATILKNNMFNAMDPKVRKQIEAFGGVEAHHLVPGYDPYAKSARELLKKFDIDINGPENGIFLPSDANSIYKGTVHNTSHSPMYSKYLYTKMKDCKNREEIIEVMTKLKHELYEGKLMLKDGKNIINKNI